MSALAPIGEAIAEDIGEAAVDAGVDIVESSLKRAANVLADLASPDTHPEVKRRLAPHARRLKRAHAQVTHFIRPVIDPTPVIDFPRAVRQRRAPAAGNFISARPGRGRGTLSRFSSSRGRRSFRPTYSRRQYRPAYTRSYRAYYPRRRYPARRNYRRYF